MSTISYRLPDNRILYEGQAFSLSANVDGKTDTISFPNNWLSLASNNDLSRFGITKTIIQDPTPGPLSKEDLLNYAAEKRRTLANGSASINLGTRSIQMWVDPESRGSILGLVVALQSAPETPVPPWKGAGGTFYQMTAAEVQAAAFGIMGYIGVCFATESGVVDAIEAGTVTTYAQIDAAFSSLG